MILQVAINCLDSNIIFIALHNLFNIGRKKMKTPGCKSHLCLSFFLAKYSNGSHNSSARDIKLRCTKNQIDNIFSFRILTLV